MRMCLAAILFNSACGHALAPADLVEADVLVPREDAKALSASFTMGAGDLDIAGGECELLQAKLRYDAKATTPKVDYTIDDQGFGTLKVREEKRGDGSAADWAVCLTRGLPLELAVDLGAGDSDVALAGVQLRSLVVRIGTGDVEVDISRSILAASEVSIDGGVGDLKLVLPTNVGVRVHVSRGAGTFRFASVGLRKKGKALVNDQWGKAERSVDVHVSVGVGSVELMAQ